MLVLISGLIVAAFWLALPGTTPDAGQPQPQARQSHIASQDYDLPAGPLADNWIRICMDAQLTCVAESALIEKVISAPVQGHLKAQQAIEQLLRGTGLELVEIGPDSYSLHRIR